MRCSKRGEATSPESVTPRFGGGRSIRTPEDRAWLKLLYDGEVRYVDDNIDRLIANVKDLGIYDDALIVLTSDHGEEFWDHGNWEHGHTLYNELVTVPLLIKLPGGAPKGEVHQAISTDALLPTILDICSVEPSTGFPVRRSLRHLWMRAATPDSVEPIFLSGVEYYEPREGIVFDGMKYIYATASEEEELYDLGVDPGEQNSLVGSSDAKLQEARTLLEQRRRLREMHDTPVTGSDGGVQIDPQIEAELRALGYID